MLNWEHYESDPADGRSASRAAPARSRSPRAPSSAVERRRDPAQPVRKAEAAGGITASGRSRP